MKKLLSSILMLGVLAAVMAQEDEPRELARARASYQSQLDFAAKSYLQKFEGVRKMLSQGEEPKELTQLNASYQSQLKFIAKSYLLKLESMRKMPSFSKNQVSAIKDEMANFKSPEPVVPPDAVPDKPAAKLADDKTDRLAEPAADSTLEDGDRLPGRVNKANPDDQDEDLAENGRPGIKTAKPEDKDVPTAPANVEKPADGSDTAKTYTEVRGSTLEDGQFSVPEETRKLSIGDLTADWLKELHQFASGRPRPENYDFTQDAFNSYVKGIPEDKRISEEKRFRQVSGVKTYIVRLMERNTYDKPISLKNGSPVSGGIMVNSNYISVKGRGKKFDRLGWDSIPVEQIADMLDYFADFRLRASGGATVSKAQQKLEAAQDYLRIGIFCDWYGDYESAVKFARKAVATEPKVEDSVRKYMMQ